MKFQIVLVLFVALSGCATAPAPAPYWQHETMKVTGFGVAPQFSRPAQKKLMAERAAKVNAVRELFLQVRMLPVDKSSRVSDYLPSQWTPKNFTVESVLYSPDGTCKAILTMSLEKVWGLVAQYKQQATN